MILVTVGTQLPFDRLIRSMDTITQSLDQPVFAQTGNGAFVPKHMEWQSFVEPREFENRFGAADLIVSHAGIGTVLMAMRHKKPIILYPRRATLNEHRNDHQIATVAALAGRPGIYIAQDDATLERLSQQPLEAAGTDQNAASRCQLTDALTDFISNGTLP